MGHITTRKATLHDLDTLLRFEQGIIEAERHCDPTMKKGDTNLYDLRKIVGSPAFEVIVAEADGKIVGSGYVRIKGSPIYSSHTKHAYMGFMYVEPAYRGKGVNQAVIEALKQWAREQSVTELRLEVFEDNLPAIKAYEKAGFSKLLVEMRMSLD